ncbi:hypothetical protein H012_gp040 [Acanthamoeba polyphaga moumouvirus]|uniref:Uncharacterized protein n=1 Tax=Acanthamoeba polyphaga moumouvirus TaxID=1269028 RepID=L7RE51_9VIRU|nr:hypothetical protein H012_gp040 [Acanthamoeba polyphaga moumouvirus]AGC02408.1 hypothetical protein Moumou_00893 [Acanthamoeba polyphaga moumouvirus]
MDVETYFMNIINKYNDDLKEIVTRILNIYPKYNIEETKGVINLLQPQIIRSEFFNGLFPLIYQVVRDENELKILQNELKILRENRQAALSDSSQHKKFHFHYKYKTEFGDENKIIKEIVNLHYQNTWILLNRSIIFY